MSRKQTTPPNGRAAVAADSRKPQGRVRPGGKNCIVLVLVASVILCCLAMPGAGRADEAIRVVRDSAEVRFAESVTFRVEVAAQKAIQRATLYYLQVGEGLTVKVPLDVERGQSVFEYTWPLEPGDLPVGAGLQYYWRIQDEAGNEVRTSPLDVAYDDDRFTWKPLAQGNITLFWYGTDSSRAQRLLGYATAAFSRLQEEMGITVERPVRIYVYDSKSDMSLALPSQSDAYDDRVLTLGVVVDEGTLLILGTHPDVEGTMAHELAHVVVGLATDNPYAELPRWLDEGLAMFSEGEFPADNRRALEDAVRRDALISVRSLSGYTGKPEEVDLFYGEVYSLVDFMLRTYGKEKMTQLLAAVREGLYQEEALQRVYGFGLDELDAQWRTHLGLGPRPTPGTPAAASTPSTPTGTTRPDVPCAAEWLSGLVALAVVASRRWHARAA